MGTRFVSRLALATVAAVGLYIPTMGLPLPLNVCLPTVGVANAAPSPTCASDLRECLRVSAREGLYGVRYVTAEDVARCTEAFNACIHGGASEGGTTGSPQTTVTGGDSRKGLPQRLSIETDEDLYDCSISGTSFACTSSKKTLAEGLDFWNGQVTGTLSGLTMTGSYSQENYGHNLVDPGCLARNTWSGPVVYTFSPDGTVGMKWGPVRWGQTLSGTCTGSGGDTRGVAEWTANWSPKS